MTNYAEIPFEVNEADIVEQRQPIGDDDNVELPLELPLTDADPADALDQHLAVPLDDDDWPAAPTG